jgi:AcrR family transcriptional regulator
MALYKHVANKEALLDGMVDLVIGDIEPRPEVDGAWKAAVRHRILAARRTLLVHPWARPVIESRTARSLAVLDHLDSVAQLFLAGGLSADLTHHAMHAIGSRVWGFTQDVFDSPDPSAAVPDAAAIEQLTARFPALAAVAGAVGHDAESVVGAGCDDQFEFEFALDVLLDGIERLDAQRWTSAAADRRLTTATNDTEP